MTAWTGQGVEAVKEALLAALDNEEKLLRSALAGEPLVYLVGEEFAEEYMRRRVAAGVALRSLRFSAGQVDRERHRDHVSYRKEARTLPMEARHSTLIWDGNVVVIDMETLRVEMKTDAPHAAAMKEWFDRLWDLAGRREALATRTRKMTTWTATEKNIKEK